MTLCDYSAYIWISISAVSVFISLLQRKNSRYLSARVYAAFFFAGLSALICAIVSTPVRVQSLVFFALAFISAVVILLVGLISAVSRE